MANIEKILRGKPVADKLTENLIEKVDVLKKNGIIPKLSMIRVGNREDDLSYQRAAINRCTKCGIETEVIELDEKCTFDEYKCELEKLNNDSSVHGILCFRPLPSGIDEDLVKDIILPEKDVDCFSPVNMSKLLANEDDGFTPCTPMGVIEILDYYGLEIEGKNIVVLGRSMVVGKPLSILLLNRNATVTICHSKTIDLEKICSRADIIVSCIGVGKMVKSSFIKKGAIVVDVGINFDEDGNMCGDIDFDDVMEKAGSITPVPGGVGSVTTSILASHVVKASEFIKNTK